MALRLNHRWLVEVLDGVGCDLFLKGFLFCIAMVPMVSSLHVLLGLTESDLGRKFMGDVRYCTRSMVCIVLGLGCISRFETNLFFYSWFCCGIHAKSKGMVVYFLGYSVGASADTGSSGQL